MKNKIILYICCAFTFLFCNITNAVNKKTIDWVIIDFSPYYIFSGEFSGLGRDESIISLLEKNMPDYTFTRTVYPSSRGINEIAISHSTLCMVSLYKSKQRKQHIEFTEYPATIGFSSSIAMTKKLANKLNLNASHNVSFETLLHEKNLTLGLSKNRLYGPEINKIVKNNKQASIFIRPGSDALESLTTMLAKGRIDFLLGYPSEHFYLAHSLGYEDELLQLSLKESPWFTNGYIGCSNTKKGVEDIAVLNTVLKRVSKQKAYQDILLRWLPDNLKPILAQHLNDR